jgi:hypothetical protein
VGAANGSLHINLQESTKMLGVMYVAGAGCAGQHGDDGVECLEWGCFVVVFWE